MVVIVDLLLYVKESSKLESNVVEELSFQLVVGLLLGGDFLFRHRLGDGGGLGCEQTNEPVPDTLDSFDVSNNLVNSLFSALDLQAPSVQHVATCLDGGDCGLSKEEKAKWINGLPLYKEPHQQFSAVGRPE